MSEVSAAEQALPLTGENLAKFRAVFETFMTNPLINVDANAPHAGWAAAATGLLIGNFLRSAITVARNVDVEKAYFHYLPYL